VFHPQWVESATKTSDDLRTTSGERQRGPKSLKHRIKQANDELTAQGKTDKQKAMIVVFPMSIIGSRCHDHVAVSFQHWGDPSYAPPVLLLGIDLGCAMHLCAVPICPR
jgi:hypothetical protein